MSIWASHGGFEVPSRDGWSGKDEENQTIYVDVATASDWHKLIRLSIEDEDVLLTSDEARRLACALIFKAGQLDNQAAGEAYKAKLLSGYVRP